MKRRENSMSNLTRWDAPKKFYMWTDKSGTFNFLPCPVWSNLPRYPSLFVPPSLSFPASDPGSNPFPFSEPLIQVSDKIKETLMRTDLYFVTLHRKIFVFPIFWSQFFLCRFFAVRGKCLTNTCWTVKSVFLWLAVWHGRQRRLQGLLHAICWSEGVRDLPDRRRW